MSIFSAREKRGAADNNTFEGESSGYLQQMLYLFPGQRPAREGHLSLLPRAGDPAGRRGRHGGQAPHHAGQQQLPGPDHLPRGAGGGPEGAGAVRHRLLGLPLSERHAEAAPGAGGRAGEVPAQGGLLHLLHGLPEQPGHHQRHRGPRRLRDLRQGEPRLHLRRLQAELRQDADLRPRQHGGAGDPAEKGARERGLPDRHRRRVQHGRRHRQAPGDREAGRRSTARGSWWTTPTAWA